MANGRMSVTGKRKVPSDAGVLPSGAGSGRRARRAIETRIKLFRAAMVLFAERGFSNVTVEDITEAADVGKGTFFNYFPSKDHVLGVMAEIQLSKIHEVAQILSKEKSDMRGILHTLSLRLAEEPGRSPELARAIVSAFLASNVVRELVDNQLEKGRAQVAQFIARGQKQGEIDKALKKSAVALQFQQSIMGTILLWSLHGEPSLAKRVEESFEHFWRAIASERRR